jgi:2,5-diketo-D-gluconate reductase A
MEAMHAGAAGGPVTELGGGVTMPMLGLGVWQLGKGSETEQAVEWALEAGYRHIDTATYYRNERSVGAALARSGIPRDEVFVTTKWFPVTRSPAHEVRRSLERLGLERVDLYLVHWPLPGRERRAWRAFEQIAEQGLARAIGVSNYGITRLERLITRGDARPAVNQVHASVLRWDRRLLEVCERLGIVVEAYSPLERGRGVSHPVVAAVSGRVARTPAQVMLRWALQHGMVVIPKSARRERIVENAGVFDFELPPEEMDVLDRIAEAS